MISRHMPLVGFAVSLLVSTLVSSSALAQYGIPVGDGKYDLSNEYIYRPYEVAQIDITMDPGELQAIIANPYSNVYRVCTVRFQNSVIDTTMENVGIRARGNVARDNTKFPWKLSFNKFEQGREFFGVKKFNVMADANDPSLSRSRLSWESYRNMGVPACRTHHVWWTINDGADVQGVYLNIEQVDELMADAWFDDDTGDLYKCRHKSNPANLRYVSPGSPATYRNLGNGETYQDENGENGFELFAEFVDFHQFADDETFRLQIHDWLNVDGMLRAMATDIATGDWDTHWIGGNNFYLYENQTTGRLEYIPWDIDHSYGQDYWFFPYFFGTNWATRGFYGWGNGGFGGGAPLLDRLLEIQPFEDALVRYIHEAVEGPFGLGGSASDINWIETSLADIAFTGSYSGGGMDHGYTNQSFRNSFESPGSYSAFSIPSTWGIRPYISERSRTFLSNFPDPVPLPRIFVNEIVANNESIVTDEMGEFEDYVEFYNDEDEPFDLSGMTLSDYAGDPWMWTFPEGTVIPAKDFLMVWCDGDSTDGPLHASFKLTSEGEGIWLFAREDQDRVLINHMPFPAIAEDEAYGRFPDGALEARKILGNPSPGSSNGAAEVLTLTIDGDCPGWLDVYASGVAPGSTVAFVRGNGPGSTIISSGSVCVGTELDVAGGVGLIATAVADEFGTARISGSVPENACGLFYLQALDLETCEVTLIEGL